MAKARPPLPAKLTCSIFSADLYLLEEAHKELEKIWGKIDLFGNIYEFIETNHYEKSMGKNLYKQIISFSSLIQQDELAYIKNRTNQLEDIFCNLANPSISEENSVDRPINIDPGMVTGAKFILATMKNFSHRIYLGKNVYSEVTLMYARGEFRIQPWTYPDYQRKDVGEFLIKIRSKYMKQLEMLNQIF